MRNKMTEEKLLPCPHCPNGVGTFIRSSKEIWVECDNCRASIPLSLTSQEALNRWNTRAPVIKWRRFSEEKPPFQTDIVVYDKRDRNIEYRTFRDDRLGYMSHWCYFEEFKAILPEGGE